MPAPRINDSAMARPPASPRWIAEHVRHLSPAPVIEQGPLQGDASTDTGLSPMQGEQFSATAKQAAPGNTSGQRIPWARPVSKVALRGEHAALPTLPSSTSSTHWHGRAAPKITSGCTVMRMRPSYGTVTAASSSQRRPGQPSAPAQGTALTNRMPTTCPLSRLMPGRRQLRQRSTQSGQCMASTDA